MAEPANYKDLRNATIILFIITSLVTSYRCFSRYTKRLWWHDDSVALFSTLFFIFFLIGSIYLADESSSHRARIVACYILIAGFYIPVWGARVSIVLTVVRITPWQLQRKILRWVAVFFVLQFAMLIVQAYWVCELAYTGWKQTPGSMCILPKVVPISQVVTTVISDSILIAAPLMIIRGVHIRALRFRLLSIFSVSIATTLASLAHAILVMVSPGVWETIFGGVEAAVSVIVCSMSVIIPAVLRALGVGDPFMREDTVDPNFTTGVEIARMTSTTRVELGLPGSLGTALTDSDEFNGATGTVVSLRRDSVDLGTKDDREHRLTRKVVPFAVECDVTDSLTKVRSLPVVEKDLDIGAGAEGKNVKRNST